MNNNGALVISLDFELLWGIFDKVKPEEKMRYFKSTRLVIPQILEIFKNYEISCTWAVVGMLFNKDWAEWENNKPKILPDYTDRKLSAYDFGESFRKSDNSEMMCFAPELIRKIAATPFQEIGTHTYSHYYCLEKGQTLGAFRDDLETSVSLAKHFNIDLKSLVFPRNQFNEEYLQVCRELGILNVRSNPKNWYWKDTTNNSLKNKIFRTGDAYIGPKNKAYKHSDLVKDKNELMAQKASRLFRPYSPHRVLNNLKVIRIKDEMSEAAKNNKIYHLWWHPHNFGNFPEESLSDLIEIMEHFKFCQKKYDFRSEHMMNVYSSYT
ncbi:polysaccharide deacetylase family protein [Salinimicrobium oceani]|uniref:Polysaccharide deacetylase family protein n=1 Tax=Salinimicrobium oceani TaxID=2722702 RepID=A0ABX1D277_9FLAO|nr:polysaccharide deacetylase family protein [Salinimicrobium oceani]NJW53432.1 polysaccharide deacetylase family protein [Salinimicrobium oceani]